MIYIRLKMTVTNFASSCCQHIYQESQGKAFVTSDVGQHQMFAAQYYHFDEPRKWINSGGLGTMGFGLHQQWELN